MSNFYNKILMVPGVIKITRKDWKKMPYMNYVILEQSSDELRVGCWLPKHEFFLGKKVSQPTEEELTIITTELC